MTITALKPFIPSGKDFATARRFFMDLGFSVNWEGGGYAELQLGSAVFILQEFDNPTVQENLMLLAKVDEMAERMGRFLHPEIFGPPGTDDFAPPAGSSTRAAP